MGLENTAYVANDNGLAQLLGYDDRMGFHGFLKSVKDNQTEQSLSGDNNTQTASSLADSSQTLENRIKTPKIKSSGFYFGLMLLVIVIITSALISLMTSSPSLRVLSLTSLIIFTVIAAFMSERKQAFRLKDISLLITLCACLWIMINLAQYFGLYIFNASQTGFWLTSALISLVTAWALKSRLALIVSIAATAFWGYMLFNGQISSGPLALALPAIAALQVFTAYNLGDRFSRRLPQFILYGWGLTALVFASISGLTTPSFILSALTLLTGLIYLSTTHPFRVWQLNRSRGISISSWFAFMGCCFASFWVWVIPSTFGISSVILPPIIEFIWQVGLIFGGISLTAAILFRRTSTSHSLGRRLLGGIAILILSASHYVIAINGAGFIDETINALFMIAAIILIGGLTIIIMNKFMAAIRFGHKWAMVLSLTAMIALFTAYAFVSNIDIRLLSIAAISALFTIFALALTRRPPPQIDPSSKVFRPLTPVELERSKSYKPSAHIASAAAYSRAL